MTFQRKYLTGHTVAMLEETDVMVCDGSKSFKSQENVLFHRIVWPGQS